MTEAQNTVTQVPIPDPDTLMLQKYREKIDAILSLRDNPEAQERALMEYALTREIMSGPHPTLLQKDKELKERDKAAGKKTAIAGWGAAIVGLIGSFTLRDKFYSGSKLIQGFFIGLFSLAFGLGGGYIGGRLFNGKIREESEELAVASRKAWELELARAMDAREKGVDTNRKTEIENTRTLFKGALGDIAIAAGALNEIQREHMLEVRARFLALSKTSHAITITKGWEQNPRSRIVMDPIQGEQWKKLAAESGITEAQMAEARAFVHSHKDVPVISAPASAEIATALGYLTEGIKNGLLMAQAGERILADCERLALPERASSKQEFTDVVNMAKWQRIGMDASVSPDLQAVQSAQYISAVLAAGYRQMGVPIPADIAEKIQNARSALETLSIASLEASAKMLRSSPGATAVAERITHWAMDVANRTGKSAVIDDAQVKRATDIIKKGMDVTKNYLVQQGKITEAEWPANQVANKLMLVNGLLSSAQQTVDALPIINPAIAAANVNKSSAMQIGG